MILGKANLSEWANFRGFPPPDFPFDTNFLNGWSARGGFTIDPYLLSFDPCGSSSGSAVAPAANLCAIAIGTETDGSITCPAGNNLVAGIKPTIGLVSQSGIIPIAHSPGHGGTDDADGHGRGVGPQRLQSPFGPVAGHDVPEDYSRFLDADALRGARIGIDRRQFDPFFTPPDLTAIVEGTLDAIADAGAELVDPVDPGDPFTWFDAELTVLPNEFKGDIAAYLSPLGHTQMRTLSDLIGSTTITAPRRCVSSARSCSRSPSRSPVSSTTRTTSRPARSAWSSVATRASIRPSPITTSTRS